MFNLSAKQWKAMSQLWEHECDMLGDSDDYPMTVLCVIKVA